MFKTKIPQITSVQASAGSGKTYNLAKRYLRLLLDYNPHKDSIPLKNIIAVTFANKAAVEMKCRVIEYLKKAVLSLDTSGIFDETGLSQKEVRSKSAEVLNEILNNYDNFNISTIDSFINSILKACAINIDISPNFRIEKDYSENLKFALDSFLRLSALSANLKEILTRYISQYLMSEKTGWFPKNDIYNEVEKVFAKAGNTGKDISVNNQSFDEEIFKRASNIAKKTEEFLSKFSKLDVYSTCLKAAEKAVFEGKSIFYNPDKIPKAFASPLKYKKNAAENDKADCLWEEIRKDISELCVFYACNYYGVYCGIYSKIDNEFEIQAKKDELVFLHDINKKALSLFEGDNPVMPEVYYRLSEKYRHFLIDEFQDTSPVQWAGIKRFLDESVAGGGTFFYVGDAKQAIYDFRGGSCEIFYNALSEFSQNENDTVVLNQNYRSHKEIVEFNNFVFSKENIERYLNDLHEEKEFLSGYKDLISVYSNSKQNCREDKQKGYVEIKILKDDIDDIEAETKRLFVKTVKQLSGRFDLNDVTVLCRTNAEVLLAGSWLLEEGISVESGQTLNIRNNDIIKQIVSLLTFINSPMDSLSFVSFITGEVFCKTAASGCEQMRGFVFDSHDKNDLDAFYKKFGGHYKSLWEEYFEKFFVQAGFTPVYELVLSVLEKFKIAENFKESKIFIMRFLELIKDFECDDGGLENFLEYFKNLEDGDGGLYVKSSSGGGVKIMTTHKAKGLQFPVVIAPFLKLAHTAADKPLFEDNGEKINLTYLTKNMSEFSEKLKSSYNREKAKTLMSEMNILYVLMTRAECEFYAFVPPKAGSSNNSAALLLGKEDIERGTKELYRTKSGNDESINDNADFGYKEIKNHSEKTSVPDFNNLRRRGTMLHFALSRIRSLKNKNINAEADKAAGDAKRKFLYDDADWIKDELLKLFEKKEIASVFESDEKNIFNEFEIVTSSGETYKPDKVIIGEDEIIVADFKSSNSAAEENRKQVLNYVKCLSEIYKNKNVRGCIVDIEKRRLIMSKE
ncbi:MAG: UvrD-helicase domain-containing protein [Endomicrobia bacterium]|nr:UvrD-helicase domain-containing protein [Endomicrobiia bacterium]